MFHHPFGHRSRPPRPSLMRLQMRPEPSLLLPKSGAGIKAWRKTKSWGTTLGTVVWFNICFNMFQPPEKVWSVFSRIFDHSSITEASFCMFSLALGPLATSPAPQVRRRNSKWPWWLHGPAPALAPRNLSVEIEQIPWNLQSQILGMIAFPSLLGMRMFIQNSYARHMGTHMTPLVTSADSRLDTSSSNNQGPSSSQKAWSAAFCERLCHTGLNSIEVIPCLLGVAVKWASGFCKGIWFSLVPCSLATWIPVNDYSCFAVLHLCKDQRGTLQRLSNHFLLVFRALEHTRPNECWRRWDGIGLRSGWKILQEPYRIECLCMFM